MIPLSAKKRSELRAEAHRLTPVVIIGDKGLTDEVMAEIDRSLKAHELIKVRAASGEREVRDTWLESICARLQAHPVQQIGKVFVLYRENPEEKKPKGKLGPVPKPAKAGARGDVVSAGAREKQRKRDEKKRREREEAELKRTSRPRSRTPSPLPESEPPRRRPRTSR